MNIFTEIIERESHFFNEIFIEDPIFLELEDILASYNKLGYCSTIIMALPEKEVSSFIHKLEKATEHLQSIHNAIKASLKEDTPSTLEYIYERSTNILHNYDTIKSKIHFPSRFRGA